MSGKGLRRGRRCVASTSKETAIKTNFQNDQSDQQANPTDLSSFQMLGCKLDEILRRIDKLEQERQSFGMTNDTITDISVSGVPNTHLTPQTVNVLNDGSVQSRRVITYLVKPEVDKPTFSGKNDTNPMAFLKKLKRYINSIDGQDRAVDIALECLTGSALSMLELFSDKWQTLADFERDFQKTFWGNMHQEKAKYKLVNSSWDSRSQKTMSEHFAEQIGTVRYCTIPLTESEMVNSVMRHFPVNIQGLWFTRREAFTLVTAVEFLRNIEHNVISRSDERVMNNSNQRDERVNKEISKHVNTMSTSLTNYRGQNSYRGRGVRRGRDYYVRNRGRLPFPALRWERSTDGPLNATHNKRHECVSNETNSLSTPSQSNEDESNSTGSITR